MAYPTNPKYKLIKSKITDQVSSVLLALNVQSDGTHTQTSIPFTTDNEDYKLYLKWVDEGNTAEAAD